MSDQGDARPTQTLLTDSLIVAAVPVLGYYAAYLYVEQQAWVLGIPDAFVSVSFDFVLATGVGIGIALLIFLIIIMAMFAKNPNVFGNKTFQGIWIDSMTIPACIALGILASWNWYYIALLVIAVPLIALVQWPNVRVIAGIKKKASLEEIESSMSGFLDTPLDRRLGFPVLFLVIAAFDICLGAKAAGGFSAAGRTWYWVEAGNPKNILLAKYGDDLIFKNKRTGAMTVKVVGKDEIPPLVAANIGTQGVN